MKFSKLLSQFRIAIVILFALAGARQLAGQTGSGAIHGQVLDPSGSVVADASVLLNAPGGQSLAATTNQQGIFDIKGVAPGKYTLEVIAKGFALYKNENVQITAEQVLTLNVSLAIEEQQEQVVVSGETPAVDVSPTNNAGAIVISGAALDALPDDPDELQTDLTALAGPSAGPNGGQFYIDGFTAGQLPPKSSIREIRINQNPFSAQYDKVGYGRIEIFTKPGTDKWHGGFSVNANDSAFNSENPFFNSQEAAGTPYPSYYSVQYSGNIGGPLSKKASFFFTTDIRDINDLGIVNALAYQNPSGCAALPDRAAPRLRAHKKQYADRARSVLPQRRGQRRHRRIHAGLPGLQFAQHRANRADRRHPGFRNQSRQRNALPIPARCQQSESAQFPALHQCSLGFQRRWL